MFKKTITYTDYDGVERTEEFLFNLNKAEIIEWMMTNGDYTLDKSNFMETEAYSVLFMELVTDASKAAEFFNGIMPKDLGEQVEKLMKEHPNATSEELRKIAAESAAAK